MDPTLLILGVGALVVVGAVVAVVSVVAARSRASAARRLEQERQAAGELTDRLRELERTAGSALVRTDERVRLADDELGFAIADFGDRAVADFAPALQRARQRLSEAFHLNQLLNDHLTDTADQRREWAERIIVLCRSADEALDEQQNALTARRTAAQRTPSDVETVRANLARVSESIAEVRSTVARLAERYSAAALAPISANPDQAEQLLDFAARSATVAESRLSASRDAEATTAVRAGIETVQRAEALLSAVEGFEVEALRAEATLAAMVAESRAEIGAARAMPESDRRGAIDTAIAALEAALAAVPAAGGPLDPVGSLSAVRRANTALDDAVAERTRGAERKERLRVQLTTAIDDAERQIAAARELVSDYRAPIGPDARTRLAEAERELSELTDERDPESALARARRASSLAADAATYARADIQAATQQSWDPRMAGGGYGRGMGGRGMGGGLGGSNLLGGVIGGLAIGGLLDSVGDLGDFFD